MFLNYDKSIKIWHFENLLAFDNLLHFVSSRKGGASNPPFESLNLGLSSGDNPVRVAQNRRQLAASLGFNVESIVTDRQVHGDDVRIITLDSIADDASYSKIPKVSSDAMITDVPNVCITVIIADCTPVMFYDPEKNIVGIAHAGWRGTVKNIAGKVVKTLKDKFGCSPEDIIAGIGPSIGPCCYEVGPDVVEAVQQNFDNTEGLLKEAGKDGKGYFDLWMANHRQLLEAGIPEKNIEPASQCTMCLRDTFYSYRAEGEKSGRMMAGIMLR